MSVSNNAQPWKWYWQNEQGIWVEYGEHGLDGNRSNVSVVDIEQKYLENKDGQLHFKAGKNSYVIDFSIYFIILELAEFSFSFQFE